MTPMSISVFTVSKTSIKMTPGTGKARQLSDLSTHLWYDAHQHWAYVLDGGTWYLWYPAAKKWDMSANIADGPFESLASIFEWVPLS